jgi:DNA-binding transcriptional ArsR family regulator
MIAVIRIRPELGNLLRRVGFMRLASKDRPSASVYDERSLRRLLWYLLGGTRGGPTRAEMIKVLQDRPCNANQLAEALQVDYKTVQHHIRVLEDHGLVAPSNKGTYGAVLFLTPKMEEAIPFLNEIWSKIGRSKINAADKE